MNVTLCFLKICILLDSVVMEFAKRVTNLNITNVYNRVGPEKSLMVIGFSNRRLT